MKQVIQQNDFIQKYKCTYNGIQKSIDRAYREHVYIRIISIYDSNEFLETMKIPIKDLIKKQKNNNKKYQ